MASRPSRNSTSKAYLDLVRLPNLFTAAADVTAGFFFAGAWLNEWDVLLRLAAASMCLYAAGVALNDYCDRNIDALERPTRPLPSGRVDPGRAMQLILFLFVAGVSLAFTVSPTTGLIALLLVGAIVAYDVVLKKTPLAPPTMGLCRALNFALGMYGVIDFTRLAVLRPLAIVGLYITAITFFARTEATRSDRMRLALGTLGQLVALSGLWWVWRYTPNARYHEFAYLAAGLAILIVYNGLRAIRRPEPSLVQAAVKRSILGLIVLDACIAWSVGGLEAAALTAALLIPAVILAARFRVS